MCVTGSLYVSLFSGEVIVIRYQHIAGCQSLYSYILTGSGALGAALPVGSHGAGAAAVPVAAAAALTLTQQVFLSQDLFFWLE